MPLETPESDYRTTQLSELIDVPPDHPISPQCEVHVRAIRESQLMRFRAVLQMPVKRMSLLNICNEICRQENRLAPENIRAAVEDDWHMPEKDPELLKPHVNLLKGHWEIFEARRQRYLHLIHEDYPRNPSAIDELQQNIYGMMPLIQWNVSDDGRRGWDFDNPGNRAQRNFRKQFWPTRPKREMEGAFDSLTGMLATASLSPDITQHWSPRVSFLDKDIERDAEQPATTKFRQPMGPAQIPVLALQRRADVLRSKLLENLEKIAQAS